MSGIIEPNIAPLRRYLGWSECSHRLLSAQEPLQYRYIFPWWSYGYDNAVYAHQDLKDDLKAGVKSVAVAWRDHSRSIRCLLSTVEVGLLGSVGYLFGIGVF